MRSKIRRIITGAAMLATPALLAASFGTPSAAYASTAAAQPAAVSRPQKSAALARNLNTRSPRELARSPRELAPPDAKARSLRPFSVSDRLVHICNFANQPVNVALAGTVDFGRFATRGWWIIENAQCRDLWAQYLYVRNFDSTLRWDISQSFRTMCIRQDVRFDIFQPDNVQACSRAGGTMENYAYVPDGSGTYNWNLLAA